MTEDYDELLEQNVDEVKKSVRDMDDPDYQELLRMEKGNKDRKTVKDFLQDRIDSEEVEVQEKDMDEIVEEIEEETGGGLLGSFQPTQILVGGVLMGLIIGLLGGIAMDTGSSVDGNKQAARDSLNQLFNASGTQAEIVSVEPVSGVYRVRANLTFSNPLTNQTQEVPRTIYVSKDGKYIFRGSTVQEQLQALQQAQQRQQRRRTQTETERNASATGNVTNSTQ
ncbi:MAG: disulfide isomerase DsbC N-terminal domain-containing protein [Candidatus Nanohaloarchaea archaeon]